MLFKIPIRIPAAEGYARMALAPLMHHIDKALLQSLMPVDHTPRQEALDK